MLLKIPFMRMCEPLVNWSTTGLYFNKISRYYDVLKMRTTNFWILLHSFLFRNTVKYMKVS